MKPAARLMITVLVLAVGAVATIASSPPIEEPVVILDNEFFRTASNEFLTVDFETLESSTVDFAVTDRSTTTPDQWTVGIVEPDELEFLRNGQPFRAFGLHENTGSVADSVELNPGQWTLVVICKNALEDCEFSVDLSVL